MCGPAGCTGRRPTPRSAELGPKKITINAVVPGPINTELFTAGKTEEQIKTFAGMNALARLGETEDIAKIVLFFASEESQWINGQTTAAFSFSQKIKC